MNKPKILIVDDTMHNLVAMEAALRHLDVEIFKAQSGVAALSLILRHEFAVVLMDIQMPSMDGFETASLIRSNKATAHLAIIFVTAINTDDEYVCRGYGLGAIDYLFKPVNPGILQAKVKVLLQLFEKRRTIEKQNQELIRINQKLHDQIMVRRKFEQRARDHTELVEKQRAELQRSNAELEQFAYVASHDLQEPLRKISAFCQLLREEYASQLDENAAKYIDYAVDGASRMKALITDLLSFSRVSSQQRELQPTCAQQAFDNAVANLYAPIKETDAVVTSGELPIVLAEPQLLTQLLQNLISNSLKYRHESRSPEIHVDAVRHDASWEFSIRDNGIGIEEQYFERIFEIFKRLHSRSEYSGTGIGLAVCRKLVERWSGRIWLESEPGEGSTFYFALPLYDEYSKESLSEVAQSELLTV